MKRIFAALNVLCIAEMAAGMVRYRMVGGLNVKATVSCMFVAFGLLNGIYAVLAKAPKRYPAWMLAGLTLAMLGDVMLGKNFMVGAGLFALGHVGYFLAFCALERFRWRDLAVSMAVFAAAAALLLLYPGFHFGSAMMQGVCVGYALVISGMVGKAVSNFWRKPTGLHGLIMASSVLFVFSDGMLALVFFAGAPRIADTLCLFTYYPAQTLLAHSIFWYGIVGAAGMVTAR